MQLTFWNRFIRKGFRSIAKFFTFCRVVSFINKLERETFTFSINYVQELLVIWKVLQKIVDVTDFSIEEFATTDPKHFHYLNQSGCFTVDNIDDKADFEATRVCFEQWVLILVACNGCYWNYQRRAISNLPFSCWNFMVGKYYFCKTRKPDCSWRWKQ